MTLNRDWYNSLVDDDGSGVTGSVWDKADVNSLMTVIDAEFARLISSGSYTPYLTTDSGGSALYTAQTGVWAQVGALFYVAGHVTLSSKGSLAASSRVLLAGSPLKSSGLCLQSVFSSAYFSGLMIAVTNLTAYIEQNSYAMRLTYTAPPGSGTVNYLTSDHLTGVFDLVFGGCFRVDF